MTRLPNLEDLKRQVVEEVANGRFFPVSIAFVADVLEAFLRGGLTAAEVADYAEFLDVNDDIEFENDEICADVVFRMSSPEINGWMTTDRAVTLLRELR